MVFQQKLANQQLCVCVCTRARVCVTVYSLLLCSIFILATRLGNEYSPMITLQVTLSSCNVTHTILSPSVSIREMNLRNVAEATRGSNPGPLTLQASV